jgi:medium-chain acyl-[acyl-carrier-protein] hydrolase
VVAALSSIPALPEPSLWLPAYRALPSPRVRLVCCPYAGASATLFHAWPSGLPADVEVRAVQLPARQSRLREPPLTRVAPIVDRIVAALGALPPAPLALYGHSFGSLVAFELARRLSALGAPPIALVVAARRPPHLPHVHTNLYALPEPELLAALHERYGTPWSLLRDRDLMELALPPMRADMEAIETHVHVDGDPLDLPVTVLRALRDAALPADEAAEWSELVRGGAPVHEIDAGHFFMDTHRAWVLARVADAIADGEARRRR